jgi:ubiquinone/menaquinone biosynthesis C-methylase UbiE
MPDEKRFSGKMGEEYDLLKRAYPKYDELHRIMADAIAGHYSRNNGDGIRVLEIGCGSGITSEFILKSRGDLFLTAIDNEPKMIIRAGGNLEEYLNNGRLALLQVDALDHLESLSNTSVDVVASGFTLHNFLGGYRTSVMKQSFRVLKPGSLFVNADKYSLEGQEMFDELGLQLERFFDAFVPLGKIELLREWVLHNVADQAPDRVMREKDAVKEMEEIGFVDINVHYRHGLEAVVSGKKPGK